MFSQPSRAKGTARRLRGSSIRASPSCGSASRPTPEAHVSGARSARARPAISLEAAALNEAECDEALGDQAAAAAIYERLSRAEDHRARRRADAAGTGGEGVGRHGQGEPRVRARLLRVSVQRSVVARRVASSTRSRTSSRSRRATTGTSSSWAAPSGSSASKRYAQARTGVRGSAQRGAGRRPRAGEPAGRRVRLLSEAPAQRARRSAAVHRPRVAQGRGDVLLRRLGRASSAITTQYLKTRPSAVPTSFRRRPGRRRRSTTSRRTTFVQDDDEKADDAFREMYEKFPVGRYAERAAWKIGWWAYRNGRYADTTRVFEAAAAEFPRSDYRPCGCTGRRARTTR